MLIKVRSWSLPHTMGGVIATDQNNPGPNLGHLAATKG